MLVTPSPPPGAERVGVRWGIPERRPIPTSPSHAYGVGPSLSPLKGGEGYQAASPPFGAFARQHQLLADARLHRRMAGVAHDDAFRLRPGARQLIGAANRAHHVVAPLNDD